MFLQFNQNVTSLIVINSHIRVELKRLLSTARGLAAPLLCLYTSIAAVAVQQDMSPYLLAIFISQPMASFLNLSHLT